MESKRAKADATPTWRTGQHPTKYSNYQGGVARIATVVTPFSDENLRVAAQSGVTDIVYYDMNTMPSTVEEMAAIRKRCEAFKLRLAAIEGGPPMDLIVQGKPGRDAQISHYIHCIQVMGQVGVPVLCYNFMPWSFRVARTSYSAVTRGGSLTSEWRWSDFDDNVRTEEGETTHADMWANFEYFLNRVIPAAEEAGVYLACHPDDPPHPRLRGLARIMDSVEAFERMLGLVDSPHNGITFCMGCFAEMGIDITQAIRRLGPRVHFVHYRNIMGNALDGFIETWQDDGQTDMKAALEAWRDIGYNGIVRPDHVPLLPDLELGDAAGEKARGYQSGKASGYTMLGRLWAFGYMRAMWQAVYGWQKGSYANQVLDGGASA